MEILSVLLGGGIVSFIIFLINRFDARHDKIATIGKDVEKLAKKIEELDNKFDERDAITARVRILRFADEMRQGVPHSKDAWDQARKDCDFYHDYCRDHPRFENGITGATVDIIDKGYHDRLEKNDFL